jgi:uncharacterized protein YndB with AHSA1/START domain
VPTVARSRTIAAEREAVWELVCDPWHLPRWWPELERVEEVSEDAWTKVMTSPRGRTIRADFTRVEAEAPERLVWRQEIEESPFEAILSESVTEILLAPADVPKATLVELRQRRRLRGRYRLGRLMVRRATRRQLEGALDGLEQAFGPAS